VDAGVTDGEYEATDDEHDAQGGHAALPPDQAREAPEQDVRPIPDADAALTAQAHRQELVGDEQQHGEQRRVPRFPRRSPVSVEVHRFSWSCIVQHSWNVAWGRARAVDLIAGAGDLLRRC
jgi:hypothetical protein